MTSDPSERPHEASAAGPVGAGNPPPPPVAEASSEEPRPAGPDPDDGGALRAGSSSTPPSSAPPAGGDTTGDTQISNADVTAPAEELLADAQRERDEYLDLAKRTKADFENFRKRMATETQAAFLRGRAEISLALIDAVDNLERALAAAGVDPDGEDAGGGAASESSEDTGAGSDGLAHGVLLVFRGLRETLGQMGIEAVNPKGEKFDPQLHEALSTMAADGAESGTVVEVMQKGYRLGEQLVRPARVVVAE